MDALKLNVVLDSKFAGNESEIAHGTATVAIGDDSLIGEYHLEDTPAAVMAGITVACDAEGTSDAVAVDDVTVELNAKVKREFVVAAGDTVVATGLPLVTGGTIKVVADESTATATATVGEDGKVTLTADTTKGILVLELPVKVAEGKLASSLINHNLTLEAGEVHLDAYTCVARKGDAKPERESLSIRPAGKLHF